MSREEEEEKDFGEGGLRRSLMNLIHISYLFSMESSVSIFFQRGPSTSLFRSRAVSTERPFSLSKLILAIIIFVQRRFLFFFFYNTHN